MAGSTSALSRLLLVCALGACAASEDGLAGDLSGRADLDAIALPLSEAGTRPADWVWVDAWDPAGVHVADDGYPLESGWYVGGYHLSVPPNFAFHIFVGRFDAGARRFVETAGAFPRWRAGVLSCVPEPQWGLDPGAEGGSRHPGLRFWPLEPGSGALSWATARGLSTAELYHVWSRGLVADIPILAAAFRVDGRFIPYEPAPGIDGWLGGYNANSNTYGAYVLHAWGLEGDVEIPQRPASWSGQAFGTFAVYRKPGGDGTVRLCAGNDRSRCNRPFGLQLSR